MNWQVLATLIERWRSDPGGTYQTWFLWEERLKNFRSIRRGSGKVKLGRWNEYLAMREGMLRLNREHQQLFSNDLGCTSSRRTHGRTRSVVRSRAPRSAASATSR